MRILQVLHQGGGSGSVSSTLHLSIGLAERGHHVRFVCPPGTEVEAAARAANLEVHPLSLAPGQRRENARKLHGLLTQFPVDIINSQSSRDRAALTWLGITDRLAAPLVFTRRQMPLTFPLENWIASRVADRVVAVSRAVGDALVRRGTPRRKLAVIPNGLIVSRVDGAPDAAQVDRWRDRIGWDREHRTIGIISRKKDQAVVLRALAGITEPIRLVLAGVERSGELAQLADRVPVRHVIVFVPFDPGIRPLYELLELVLLPSRMEGLSQALLEAMALGKPVVASAAAGNLDLIRDGEDGRLVPPLDPSSWTQAIESILRNPGTAEAMGSAARRTARTTFSLDHTVDRTQALFHEVLKTPAGSLSRVPGDRA
ncbi:MAG: glycosyltransferase family 4 protein [Gemmatimonadota bacterium]